MFGNPVVRLVARAVIAAVGAANAALIQGLVDDGALSSGDITLAVLLGIGAGIALSGIEVVTPVNSQVGLNK